MPPPSPVPAWARGEVCMDRTARVRTVVRPYPGTAATLRGRLCFRLRGRLLGDDQLALVLMRERQVNSHERLFLVLGERGIPQDFAHQVMVGGALFEAPGPHVEGFG